MQQKYFYCKEKTVNFKIDFVKNLINNEKLNADRKNCE